MKIFNEDLAVKAYERVKALIRSKQLKPGQKIVQEKLAKELGISRTPLRSGLQMLEAESLIESIPRRGVVVKEFTNEEILEIYDCRIAMECMAARLFAERASKDQIDRLYELFSPFKNLKIIPLEEYQKADSEFHDTLIKECGNKFLYNLFRKGNLLLCIDLIGLIRHPEETLSEHLEIIDSLKKRKTDEACSLIEQHLNITRELILQKIADGK